APPPAFADSPTIAVDQASIAPGETLTLRGEGWPVSTELTATLYDPTRLDGVAATLGMSFTANGAGAFRLDATVPTELTRRGSTDKVYLVPGDYVILVAARAQPNVSVFSPLTIGAPQKGSMLWGEMSVDTNGN